MALDHFFLFFAPSVLLLIGAMLVTIAALHILRRDVDSLFLARVDLVSYALGGVTIILAFSTFSIREGELAKIESSAGAVIQSSDPYFFGNLLPSILIALEEDCPENEECISIRSQIKGFYRWNLPAYEIIDASDDLPLRIRELVLKYNFSLLNRSRPAFGFDWLGRFRLLVIVVASIAYSLGLWRRVESIKKLKQA